MKTHERDFTFLPELIISDREGKPRNIICCYIQVFNTSLKSQLQKKKLTKVINNTVFISEIYFKTYQFILNELIASETLMSQIHGDITGTPRSVPDNHAKEACTHSTRKEDTSYTSSPSKNLTTLLKL